MSSVFFAGIIGGIYSETENNQDGIRNIQGFFFITALNQGFNSASSSAGAFIKEKVIVNR